MSEKNIRERERSEAAKKAALRKKKRRRRRSLAALFVFILISAITLYILSLTVLFKIDGITVENNVLYSEGEIISAAEVKTGDNLFALNFAKIEKRITTTLPFVVEVKLKKQLPSKLSLIITETKEEVCYYKDGVYYAGDKKGKILKEYNEKPTELIIIKTSKDIEIEVGKYINFANAEEKDLINKHFQLSENFGYSLSMIDVGDIYNSRIKIDNRFIAEFGSYGNIESKAAHLNAMLKQMEARKTGIIDLKVWTPEKAEAFFTERSIEGLE